MSLLKLGLPIADSDTTGEAGSVIGPEGMIVAAAAHTWRAFDGTPAVYRLAHLVILSIVKLVFRFVIVGAMNIPAGKPYIVVANHLNWLDSLALLIALPCVPRVHFVGCRDILQSPKLSWALKLTKFGFIPIDCDPAKRSHHGRETLRALDQCLRYGNPVVLYPEEEIGREEGTLGQFNSGFARLASMSGVSILPVALSGTSRLWLRKVISITIGSLIPPGGQNVQAVVERTRQAMVALMPSPALYEGKGPRLLERRLTTLFPALPGRAAPDL